MSSWGLRITTRTAPPTRRSTVASVVSQSCSACHQRRITSSLVQASKTACAGARYVRSMRRVVLSITAPAGGATALRARRAPSAARRRRPSPTGEALPAAHLPGVRSRDLGLVVLVVEVPPLVRRGLRVALGRVLPLLLAAEGAHVEVAPGAPHRLVAAAVDEVGAED